MAQFTAILFNIRFILRGPRNIRLDPFNTKPQFRSENCHWCCPHRDPGLSSRSECLYPQLSIFYVNHSVHFNSQLEPTSVSIHSDRGVTEAAMTYASIAAILLTFKDGMSASITSWILLTCLLKRPHNLLLTLLQLVQYSLLQPIIGDQLRPFHQGLASYWIGMSWYFHQVLSTNLFSSYYYHHSSE